MIKLFAIIPVSCFTFCAATYPTAVTPQPNQPDPVPVVQGVKPVTESPQPPQTDGDKLDRMESMLVALIGGQKELKQLAEDQVSATEDSTTAIVLAIRESKPDFSELIAAIKSPEDKTKAVTPVAEQPVDDKAKPQPQPQQPQYTYRTETRYRTAYRLEKQCFGSYCRMVNVPYQQAYQVQVKVLTNATRTTGCGCPDCTCENCVCGMTTPSDVVPVPEDGTQPQPSPQPSPDYPPGDDGVCPPQPRLFQGRVIQRVRNVFQFWRNVRGAFLNRRVMRFNARG